MGHDTISIIIFIACIVVFLADRMPMATTAIGGCVAMVIFGVSDFKVVFAPFASSTVILTIGVMILGAAIAKSGLGTIAGRSILKFAKGSEKSIIFFMYITAAVMSAFLTNSAVLAIFIPLISSLSDDIDIRNIIMPVSIACVLGGTTTLVGSTQQLTAQGLLEGSGIKMFHTFEFTPVGICIVLVGLLYCLTIGRKLGIKVWSDRPFSADKLSAEKEQPICVSQTIKISVIFIFTVICYITEWFPLPVTAILSALLCIVSGVISQNEAFESINWDIVGRLAGCLGLAQALQDSGGTDIISDAVSNFIVSSSSPYILFCLFVLFVQTTSAFISNSTAILIVMPILFSIDPSLHLNLHTFALGITLASGVSVCCPLASSTLGMSMIGGFHFSDYFRSNFILDILNYLLIITIIPFFYSLS